MTYDSLLSATHSEVQKTNNNTLNNVEMANRNIIEKNYTDSIKC